MDINCRICGEPWEMDSLHDLEGPFKKNFSKFKKLGCGAFNSWNNQPDAPCTREPIMSPEYMEALDVLTDLNVHPDDLASDLDSLPLMLQMASRK